MPARDAHRDARTVEDITRTAYTAKKAIASTSAYVATAAGELLATGLLHGTAQTVVQCVVAVLGVFGVHQATYRAENTPKRVPSRSARRAARV